MHQTIPSSHAPGFTAAIRREGVNYLVATPESVTDWFGTSGYVPVAGLVNGIGIRATLVPKPAGRHSVFLNAEMRREAEIGEGDDVSVTLWLDTSDRSPQMPADVEDAFAVTGVLDIFEGQSESHQREMLVWIEDAKRAATRQSRISKAIEHLRDR